MFEYEKALIQKGVRFIAGVDEVGRGCLAGPMVVAAVILNADELTQLINNDVSDRGFENYLKIKDSKKLNPKIRKELADFIKNRAANYSIEIIDPKTIDELRLSKCTQTGFFNAVNKLTDEPDHILTDAFPIKAMPHHIQTNLMGGDNISISIAAASIVAKVFRDELMISLHHSSDIYRKYSFDKHKGYGTKLHMQLLNEYGPCDLHRESFAPVKIASYRQS